MKKVFSLMLIFTMVVFAGCLTDSDDGDDGDGGNGGTTLSAATYMPFKTGSVWTYSDTSTDYWSGAPDVSTETSTLTCTGQTTLNGSTYWILVESESDSPMYFRLDDNNVYGVGIYDDMMMKQAAPVDLPAEVLMFKFGVSSGTSWTIYSDSSSEGDDSWSVSVTGKYLGTETVSTPAGSYENCAKFETTASFAFTYTYNGISFSEDNTTTSHMWFAPNVGPVKTSDEDEFEGAVVYSYISVLTSYVPGN